MNLQRGRYPIAHAGGAIILTRSNIEIIESSFIQNRAEASGAIFCERDSNVSIVNSIFEQNRAFSQNVNTDCYGGALFCQSSCTLRIHNTTFTNNTAVKKQRRFTLSLATYSGGAIAIVGAAGVTISECNLSDNRATDDGGVLYALGGTANFNMVFDNNYTSEDTGIIEIRGSKLSLATIRLRMEGY